jgi:CheY-like chemotaxis protein
MAKILLVDDEEDILTLVAGILKKEGYETESALSGKDALSLLQEKKFDLLLLDLMMPDMDGFEVCKEMQANPDTKNIPVIVVTVKGDFGSIETAYKCSPVKNYITKPFERKNLLNIISQVLGKEEAQLKSAKPPKPLREAVYKEIIDGSGLQRDN